MGGGRLLLQRGEAKSPNGEGRQRLQEEGGEGVAAAAAAAAIPVPSHPLLSPPLTSTHILSSHPLSPYLSALLRCLEQPHNRHLCSPHT